MDPEIAKLYPEYTKLYGPYERKDGRSHVIFIDSDLQKRTVSWSKIQLELKIGRRLIGDETCDHKNNDFTDDSWDNLQVLSRGNNVTKAFYENDKIRKDKTFSCFLCGKIFVKDPKNMGYDRIKLGIAGPFCSRQCSGKYGAWVQNFGRLA